MIPYGLLIGVWYEDFFLQNKKKWNSDEFGFQSKSATSIITTCILARFWHCTCVFGTKPFGIGGSSFFGSGEGLTGTFTVRALSVFRFVPKHTKYCGTCWCMDNLLSYLVRTSKCLFLVRLCSCFVCVVCIVLYQVLFIWLLACVSCLCSWFWLIFVRLYLLL